MRSAACRPTVQGARRALGEESSCGHFQQNEEMVSLHFDEARRIVLLALLLFLAPECNAACHAPSCAQMEAPRRAGSLWRYCGVSCSAQAV